MSEALFSGCPSVTECVRPGVDPVSTISYKPIDAISPTSVAGVAQSTDELINFEGRGTRGQGQGHRQIKYLSELLLRVKACTHRRLVVEVPSSSSFYPRDAMLARVFAIATCPSVCLSAARRYCA